MSFSDLKVYSFNTIAFMINLPQMDKDFERFLGNVHNFLAIVLVFATIIYTAFRIRSEIKKNRYYAAQQKMVERMSENEKHEL